MPRHHISRINSIAEGIYKAEAELMEMRSKLGEGHPRVEKIKSQIDTMTKNYSEMLAAYKNPRKLPAVKPESVYGGRNFDDWLRIAMTDKQPKTVAEAMKACGVLAETEQQRKQILVQLGSYLREHASIVLDGGDSETYMSGFVGALAGLPASDKVDFFANKIPDGSDAEMLWLSQAFSSGVFANAITGSQTAMQNELGDRAIELLKLFADRESCQWGACSAFQVLVRYVDSDSKEAQEIVSDLLLKLGTEARAGIFQRIPSVLVLDSVLEAVKKDLFSQGTSPRSRDQLVGGLDNVEFGPTGVIQPEPDFGIEIIEDLLVNQLTDSSPLEFENYAVMYVVDGREQQRGFGGGVAVKEEDKVTGVDVVTRRLLNTICVRILDEHSDKSGDAFAKKAAKIVQRIRSQEGFKDAIQRKSFALLSIEQDLKAIEAFAEGERSGGEGGGNQFSTFVNASFENRQHGGYDGGFGHGGGGFGGGVF